MRITGRKVNEERFLEEEHISYNAPSSIERTRKNIIIVAGHAGSGKTELSKRISMRTGFSLLDKDTLTRPFVERLASYLANDPNDRQSAKYLHEIRPLEYQVLMDSIWEILDFGAPGVVVTAPFLKELNDLNWIDNFKSTCDTKSINLTLVWVHCDKENLEKRIINRGASRDHWKIQNWDEWVKSLNNPLFLESCVYMNNSEDSTEIIESYTEAIIEKITH